jgi:hypothetical protein
MEIAFGILGWTPTTFWSATLAEFFSAYDGWAEFNIPEDPNKAGPPTRERNEELKQRYG